MSIPGGDLPLVARDSELTAVRQALDAAVRGVGGAVCFVGPAGIGKTRLATESLELGRAAGFRCAWGAGWTEAGVPPLWPWQSVLSQLGHHDEALLIAADQSEQERFATFRTVANALAADANVQPVLIVIDDAHAADLGALLLARFVVRTLRALPVLMVVTARNTDDVDAAVRSAFADLAHDATVLHPAALSVDDLDGLLRRVGRVGAGPGLDEMHALTGGNPLFVGEVLAAARAGSEPTADSARTILRLRLGGLPPQAHQMLAAAAMLGPLARTSIVLAVCDLSSNGDGLIRAAEGAGVLVGADDGQCRFTHRLLADAVLAELRPNDLADLHSRVADVLERVDGSAVEHVVATAHHRMAVASIRRDRSSIVSAVDSCQRASVALVAGLAYESASRLLAGAVELHGHVDVAPPTRLLLDVARIELAAGNLREARSWFRRAADQADDPVDLAESAVGLGGIWVHEHRTAAEHAAFMALLQRALANVGVDRPDLSARLRMRIAAEQIYTGDGSAGAVVLAVERARAVGDPLVLAESLSLWHHTLLGPANTGPQRLLIADELVRVAAAAGDEVLVLMGVLWRAVDMYLIGDQRAERALAEVRERADALQVAAVLFVIDAIDVMRLLREGRIEVAEEAAQRCFERGISIGDADAVGYLGGHLLTIRWLQRRPDDILPMARQVARSPTLVEGDVAPRAAAAVLAAMLGDDDQARADLHHVMTQVPRSVHTSSNWMVNMFCAAEAALLLGDLKTADAVYAELLPFRHLPIMGSVGVVCLGSAERSLGVAAKTLGDIDLAVHHFEQAVEHNHRLANLVMVAISEGDLGCTLIERACAGDVARGSVLVDGAVRALDTFGLHDRSAMLRGSADQRLRSVPVPDGEISRSGSTWRLAYGDHIVEVADSVGVQRLRQLLERPFTDVTATELAGELTIPGRHEVNDAAALRAYRERIDELRDEIDQADADHDLEQASARRVELDELLEHLAPSLGLHGSSRAFSDGVERARVTVRKSLGRVFDAVREQDAEFAGHLLDSIRTGVVCRFEPAGRFPVVWEYSADD